MKVSVIIPAYNAAETIAATVQSALAQTHADVEVVVCDDGSTDSTRAVLDGIADERLRVYALPHANANVARNYGVQHAAGEYIAFLDADDTWLPEHLERALRVLQQRRAGCAYGSLVVGRRVHTVREMRRGESAIDYLLTSGYGAQTSTLVMTAESARAVPWDETLNRHQDYDFVARYAKQFKLVPKLSPTVVYNTTRKRTGGIDFDSCIRAVEAHRADISPDVYRRYCAGMLRMATARKAAEHVIGYYAAGAKSKPVLSIIIPFLNEGSEVEKTVLSIEKTAVCAHEVILINDASTDVHSYREVADRHGCRYVEHEQRRGVAASRDEGVALAEGAYIVLLDAHVALYERGWDARIVGILQARPQSVLCCRSMSLRNTTREHPRRMNVAGARFAQGAVSQWRSETDAERIVEPVPCVLGGAYATTKAFYEQLHGLQGLRGYGYDEEFLSLKVAAAGGECLCVKDWEVGHLYRPVAPYKIESADVTYNRLLTYELLLDGSDKLLLDEHTKKTRKQSFGNAQEKICANREWIAAERQYLRSVFAEDAEEKLRKILEKK